MPKTRVILYCEEDGSSLFLEWIEQLPVKAQDKCLVRVERLRELGHELRRPEADLQRDGIYEPRASLLGIHHRILYFFHGAVAANRVPRNCERARRSAEGNRSRL